MSVEIVAFGNEVLQGLTVNTNASFLSDALRKRGYQVARHTVLPDETAAIEEGLKDAWERSSLVITTGGLGPTLDDLTESVLKRIFTKAPLLLKNNLGSAPGLAFTEKGKTLIALPGVPREMEEMFLLEAFPYIEKMLPLKEKLFMEELHFAHLPEASIDRFLTSQKREGIEIGIYPSLGILHVTFTVFAKTKEEAHKIIAPLKKKTASEFSRHMFEAESGKIEEAVHQDFIAKKKTVAFAESCTGGLLAKRLTSLPGASNYFLGSFVCYADALKHKILHVSPSISSVSKKAVEEMAEGVFQITSADYALAVSGVAGPTGEKPVGTIYAALGKRGGPIFSGKFQAKGRNREGILEYASSFCLFSLWKYLTSEQEPLFS